MNTKPIIGINADFRPASNEHIALTWIQTGYYDQITGAKTDKSPGGIPLIIPPLADDKDLQQCLGQLDGIVLGGCSLDLDPRRLGLDKHPAAKPMPTRREDFDRRLCKLAVEMRLPILAIGAGMQTVSRSRDWGNRGQEPTRFLRSMRSSPQSGSRLTRRSFARSSIPTRPSWS